MVSHTDVPPDKRQSANQSSSSIRMHISALRCDICELENMVTHPWLCERSRTQSVWLSVAEVVGVGVYGPRRKRWGREGAAGGGVCDLQCKWEDGGGYCLDDVGLHGSAFADGNENRM